MSESKKDCKSCAQPRNIDTDISMLKHAIVKLVENINELDNKVTHLQERIDALRTMTINNIVE